MVLAWPLPPIAPSFSFGFEIRTQCCWFRDLHGADTATAALLPPEFQKNA
jgi:hypothetical protein